MQETTVKQYNWSFLTLYYHLLMGIIIFTWSQTQLRLDKPWTLMPQQEGLNEGIRRTQSKPQLLWLTWDSLSAINNIIKFKHGHGTDCQYSSLCDLATLSMATKATHTRVCPPWSVRSLRDSTTLSSIMSSGGGIVANIQDRTSLCRAENG